VVTSADRHHRLRGGHWNAPRQGRRIPAPLPRRNREFAHASGGVALRASPPA